jgi:dihydroneopterin aldolase
MIEDRNIILTLAGLEVPIHLGVTEQERNKLQKIIFSIKFYFDHIPSGCVTDEISHTICYDHVARLINGHCKEREFKLIERLGYEVFKLIRSTTDDNIKIWLKIVKNNPLVDHSLMAAEFEYSDK